MLFNSNMFTKRINRECFFKNLKLFYCNKITNTVIYKLFLSETIFIENPLRKTGFNFFLCLEFCNFLEITNGVWRLTKGIVIFFLQITLAEFTSMTHFVNFAL
jgi:hypothetical protein